LKRNLSKVDDLKQLIREVPDFPKPGINFYDITTLLKDPAGFRRVIDAFAERFGSGKIDVVAAAESRGFLFGGALAYKMGAALVPFRKPGKLPAETISVSYGLEYGKDALHIHKDAIAPGQNVLILDDVLATGGTAAATAQLVETLGGKVAALAFLIELDFLNGREKLAGREIVSLLHY